MKNKEKKSSLINIHARTGAGRNCLLQCLNIDRKNTLYVDFKKAFVDITKHSQEPIDNFNESRIVYADAMNPLESLFKIKEALEFKTPEVLLIDEAQVLFGEETFSQTLLLLASALNQNCIIILSSQEKIELENAKYFELTDLSKVEFISKEVNEFLASTGYIIKKLKKIYNKLRLLNKSV